MTEEQKKQSYELFLASLSEEQMANLSQNDKRTMHAGWILARQAQDWRPFDNTRTGIFLVRIPSSRNGVQVANFTDKVKLIGYCFDFDVETPDLMMSIPEPPKYG